MGRTIGLTAGDGGAFSGYLAVPGSGSGPGIVLLQEIFGVNANIRAVADAYAEEGYVVLAPDLFWRLEPGVALGFGEADMQKAFALYGRFDVDQGVRDIAASVAALRGMAACTGQVGAIGFCLGGLLAVLAAARAGVDCAVGYYGVGIEGVLDEAAGISVPLLLHFGATDAHVPPAAVAAITARLSGEGGDPCVSGGRARIFRGGAGRVRQAGGDDGAFAVGRAVPSGDGAAVRPERVVGQALRV